MGLRPRLGVGVGVGFGVGVGGGGGGPRGRACRAGAQPKRQQFASFAEMLAGSPAPVLVDFYASWCGPCVMMQQELKKARAQLGEDRLSIFKVDTEKYPKLATRHKVQGLPTMVLFKEGVEVGRFEGAMTAADLVQKLEYFLAA